MFELEIYDAEKGKWLIWTKGSLDECFSDFYYIRGEYPETYTILRVVYKQPDREAEDDG